MTFGSLLREPTRISWNWRRTGKCIVGVAKLFSDDFIPHSPSLPDLKRSYLRPLFSRAIFTSQGKKLFPHFPFSKNHFHHFQTSLFSLGDGQGRPLPGRDRGDRAAGDEGAGHDQPLQARLAVQGRTPALAQAGN